MNKTLKKNIIILLFFIFVAGIANAENKSNYHFQQGLSSAHSLKDKAFNALKNYNPNAIINNYTENPKETDYFKHPETIKERAKNTLQQDEVANHINQSIEEREKKFQFSKDPNSKDIQNIKKRAEPYFNAITDQFSDCVKHSDCKTIYETVQCNETKPSTLQYCKKKLSVEIVPHQVDKHYIINIQVYNKKRKYAGIVVNAVSGGIAVLDPHDTRFTMSGRLPAGLDCHSLQGRVISEQGDAKIDYIYFPSCATNFALNFHISGGHLKNFQVEVTSSTITYEQRDHWQDDCNLLNKCIAKEEHCVVQNETHNIQNFPVTRECWEKELTYACGYDEKLSGCDVYREKGCEQIGSLCTDLKDEGCVSYTQTFRCPIKQCTDTQMICNGETYCLNGDCVKQNRQADPDFQRAVSALSATNNAAKDFSQFNSIFAGKKKTCDKFALGFLDCCNNKGWGKDHIASCSQEEKDLRIDKKNLTAVYVGEYCKKDPLGICIEHRKAYCVFPSRLARIIQQQGRRDQLNIDFGDPEKANCRGITREEFAALDLGKMDFSDFYADISQKTHIENQQNLNQRLIEKTNQLQREKHPDA